MRRIVAIAATAVLFVACSQLAPPIAMVGDDEDRTALVGVWQGEYQSDDGKRAGVINFELEEDEALAHGIVDMRFSIVDAGGNIIQQSFRLRIRFVRAEGGLVSGMLERYTDPHCGCDVITEFVGEIEANMLIGTYETRTAAGMLAARGFWSAHRKGSSS